MKVRHSRGFEIDVPDKLYEGIVTVPHEEAVARRGECPVLDPPPPDKWFAVRALTEQELAEAAEESMLM